MSLQASRFLYGLGFLSCPRLRTARRQVITIQRKLEPACARSRSRQCEGTSTYNIALYRAIVRPGAWVDIEVPITVERRLRILDQAVLQPGVDRVRVMFGRLFLKLGLRVSPRTVGKYMLRPAPGRPRGGQRWSTFLRNHARAIIVCDFCVAVTRAFLVLYLLVVIEHRSCRLIHFNMTASDRAVDAAAVTRGSWMRGAIRVPAARSRHHLLSRVG